MLIYKLNISSEKSLAAEMEAITCDPRGIKIMQEKLSRYTIKITDISGHLALVIKETALSCGAECAMPRDIIINPKKNCDILLLTQKNNLKLIINKLAKQAFKTLKTLSNQLKSFLKEENISIPVIMGILNTTPDSFSDGGNFNTKETALAHAKKMIKEGARIIDIGGESTRPGSAEISIKEELKRTIPIIKELRKNNKKILISIDTTKSLVAQKAAEAGANIINDISGLTRDPKIAKIAAKYKTKLIIMHRTGNSKIMQQKTEYADLIKDILSFLQKSIDIALEAGVKKENIIIDPGIGFGKTTEQNLYIIKHLCAFKSLGYPVLLGASRKSVIGNILKNNPTERTAGTIATSIMGQLNNADYLRVHDVKENINAVKIFKNLQNS